MAVESRPGTGSIVLITRPWERNMYQLTACTYAGRRNDERDQ